MIKQPIWLGPMHCTTAVSLCLGDELGPTGQSTKPREAPPQGSQPIRYHRTSPSPQEHWDSPLGWAVRKGRLQSPVGQSHLLPTLLLKAAPAQLPVGLTHCSHQPTAQSWGKDTALGCPNTQSSKHPSLQLPPPPPRLNGVPEKPLPQPPERLPARLSPLDGSREPSTPVPNPLSPTSLQTR